MEMRSFSEGYRHVENEEASWDYDYGPTQLLMVEKLTPPSSIYAPELLSGAIENRLKFFIGYVSSSWEESDLFLYCQVIRVYNFKVWSPSFL